MCKALYIPLNVFILAFDLNLKNIWLARRLIIIGFNEYSLSAQITCKKKSNLKLNYAKNLMSDINKLRVFVELFICKNN